MEEKAIDGNLTSGWVKIWMICSKMCSTVVYILNGGGCVYKMQRV